MKIIFYCPSAIRGAADIWGNDDKNIYEVHGGVFPPKPVLSKTC